MAFDEHQFIAWATSRGPGHCKVGAGDDAAILADGTVVALDTIVEGIHFDAGVEPQLLARKAVGSCLSDLCAMGAVAEAVFVSAQLSPGCDGRALAEALADWCAHFGVVLAGGDTVRAPEGSLALSVTAVGRCEGTAWQRSGGQPGDVLVLTGPVGGSRSGRHLRVEPRQDVVKVAKEQGLTIHACIDISDGLGLDLARLCRASAAGALVRADQVPIHPDVSHEGDRLEAALGDGEDFELLLAMPAESKLPKGWVPIGTLLAQDSILLERHGDNTPWPESGHVHSI
ncbi:MAG: thiamine-phosphate kinase [Planctomycetota bacterium]|jgi:thiamine-monophosphate kinase|nr:thiamine-phosphate kinase [Planctomycetota bacterium]